MKNEAEFKTLFKKSVTAQGGFCLTLAAPMISGIPDLYVIMRGFMPVLLEAKFLGKVKVGFQRKIKYSPMQRFWMGECNKVYPCTALGLIGYQIGSYIMCSLESHDAEHVHYGTYAESLMPGSRLFNVHRLFTNSCIAKINVACPPQENHVITGA